jgi:autophagy-related protein 16
MGPGLGPNPSSVHVQVLQDEVQALQLELVTTSEKQQKTESDYEQLLDRWIKKKNEEAQKVNEANLIYESYVH